jgi:hypothetical protein
VFSLYFQSHVAVILLRRFDKFRFPPPMLLITDVMELMRVERGVSWKQDKAQEWTNA